MVYSGLFRYLVKEGLSNKRLLLIGIAIMVLVLKLTFKFKAYGLFLNKVRSLGLEDEV